MGINLSGITVIAAGSLTSTWSTMWSALKSFGFLTTILVIIGTCLVVFALVKMLWAKVRNRPMDPKPLIWAIIVGTFFMFPNEIIKLLLGVVDSAINMIKKLLEGLIK